MKTLLSTLMMLLALAGAGLTQPVLAGDKDPLFINMTTDEAHRASMAIHFGAMQQAKGHPLTLLLNDKGVLVASKTNATKYADQQKEIADAQSKGAVVIACPMCMKHYGVKEGDLLPGVKVGNPDLTGAALFKANTRTLTW